MPQPNDPTSPTALPSLLDRWPVPRWLWVGAGASIGLFDFSLLLIYDADLIIAGRDATIPFLLMFLLSYGVLGWLVGGLADARRQARRDRATIEKQLAQLAQTQRRLMQEEKLAGIGRLAAGVAHEVRNPLGVIRASASMARESFESNSDPYRALGFVCDETDRLDRLIQSLLTFAKPQPIECAPTDLAKVVDRAVELARPEASDASVEIDVSIEAGLPMIHADPDRLSQAIYGLTLNAIQAIGASGVPPQPPTQGHVSIAARVFGDVVRLEVADSGPGIPDALRDQIFEPFVTTKDTGTGLGLPMALSMIEAQGGALSLAAPSQTQTDSLSGARFRIEFPILQSSRSLAS